MKQLNETRLKQKKESDEDAMRLKSQQEKVAPFVIIK